MADERCDFPGDAESQDADSPSGPASGRARGRWLDRATAERLLSGETPDNAVPPAHRAEADRLAGTLNALAALSADRTPSDEELPGEAAALAAFRKARAERADIAAESAATARDARQGEGAALAAFRRARGERAVEPVTGEGFGEGGPGESAALAAFRAARAGRADGAERADRAAEPSAPDADAGLVHIDARATAGTRPRWTRPARLGLAAALAVGMVGGVAVAAGTGVLPTPFDRAEPEPAASVSATASPESNRPLSSPSPGATTGGGAGEATPDGGPSGTPAPNATGNAKGGAGDDPADRGGAGVPGAVASACRDVRDGKTLNTERRHTLEDAAGGSSRVPAYCAQVLDPVGGRLGGVTGGQKDHDERGGWTGGDGDDSTGGKTGKGGAGGKGGSGGKTGKDGKGGTGKNGNGGKGDASGGNGGAGGSGSGHHPNGIAAPSAPSAPSPSTSSPLPERSDQEKDPSPQPTNSAL
ncbi:hypothetical protein ABZ614_09765 [Streptomyces sp. NPDC013178]|uniref:hypothetical protein n=1 Tax=Streptomyces sp. NPDC013178 TaxID=3155118 RepID=UPI00340203BF